ncbi:MAG: hypothetical protein ACERKD_04520 [Prolixibacteraceae bacterium]
MSKEIKNISKKFPKNKVPFSVPDGYFQTFSERMIDQIEAQNQPLKKQIIVRYLKPILSLAASFAIIFTLIYIPVKTIGPKMAKSNVYEMTDQDILPYLVTDELIYQSFTTDQADDIDEGVIETVLLASVSDMELMNI